MTAPWTIPKKKPRTSKMSTRNVVKKHLKEWNFDEIDEDAKSSKVRHYTEEGEDEYWAPCPYCNHSNDTPDGGGRKSRKCQSCGERFNFK